ncbi:MAG TPA: Abi family protein [Longimicrobium sp.]|nr:Abi family protein [Longimicrobium sp.]
MATAKPLRPYTKPVLGPQGLLAHLESRGLAVASAADGIVALQILERIDYYRLLSYMRPLQVTDDAGVRRFVPGTTMRDVVALYEFDRKLRLLCLDAVERIEVALRAAIVCEIAVSEGPDFYTHRAYYTSAGACDRFRDEVLRERGRNPALRHYFATYRSPEMPPIWAAMEAVTFGALSQLFSNLARPYRIRIARRFQVNELVLSSWFRAVNGVRNICAHHARLWNAPMHVNKPMAGREFAAEFTSTTDTFFDRAVVINLLLDRVAPLSGWKASLRELIDGSPHVDPARMGFPPGWRERLIWQ